MPENKRPDAKRFLTDPEFAEDRNLFGAFVEDFLLKKEEAAKKKREEENAAAGDENIFDRMFGGRK